MADVIHFGTRPLSDGGNLAEQFARRAVEIDPDDADSQAALASSMMLIGDSERQTRETVL